MASAALHRAFVWRFRHGWCLWFGGRLGRRTHRSTVTIWSTVAVRSHAVLWGNARGSTTGRCTARRSTTAAGHLTADDTRHTTGLLDRHAARDALALRHVMRVALLPRHAVRNPPRAALLDVVARRVGNLLRACLACVAALGVGDLFRDRLTRPGAGGVRHALCAALSNHRAGCVRNLAVHGLAGPGAGRVRHTFVNGAGNLPAD
jgi:hypothetical protein